MRPSEGQILESVGRNEQICTFCEQFTPQATYYLSENKTHNEIIETLHKTCSQMYSFEQQIAKIQPEEFCRKVNLCENTLFPSLPKSDDSCTLCHHVVDEVLTKLKDPDTELGIIELLLKECSKTGQYVQEKLSKDNLKEKMELIKGVTIGNKYQFQLSPLPQEVLIVWGEHDNVFPLIKAHEIKERLGEESRLEIIKNTSHVPQMEDPYRFNEVVLRFLLGGPK